MGRVERLRQRARALKREVVALYLACRDPRTPWYAKLLAAAIVAYALSPIDLIPDFVPGLGYLDDLVIVPAGLTFALKLIPAPVLADCREQARLVTERPTSRVGVVVIVSIWLGATALVAYLVARAFNLI